MEKQLAKPGVLDKYRTTRELAKQLDRTEDTIRRWIRQGRAPRSTVIARRRLFHDDDVDDARRLFYVALTRAMRRLYITYCDRRVSFPQMNTGSNAGRPQRTLTRFMRDAPLVPTTLDEG